MISKDILPRKAEATRTANQQFHASIVTRAIDHGIGEDNLRALLNISERRWKRLGEGTADWDLSQFAEAVHLMDESGRIAHYRDLLSAYSAAMAVNHG